MTSGRPNKWWLGIQPFTKPGFYSAAFVNSWAGPRQPLGRWRQEAAVGQAGAKATSPHRASRSPPGEASPASSWARPPPGASPSQMASGPRTSKILRLSGTPQPEQERRAGVQWLRTVSKNALGAGLLRHWGATRSQPGPRRCSCGSELRAEVELLPPVARCLEPGVSCFVLSFLRSPSLLPQDPGAGRRNTGRSSTVKPGFSGATGPAPPSF